MTLAEFKSWFQGFADGLDGQQPNEAQWEMIKERIGRLDENPGPLLPFKPVGHLTNFAADWRREHSTSC
jgi:hypothetical protein